MPHLPFTAAGQIALAAALAAAAFYLLLPKPRPRSVAGGTAAALAALAVFALWLAQAFARPTRDAVGTALFALFSTGALGFGTVVVAQRNPARGAIAFAFVVLSTCGLFLLLAAPFLMAATVVVYAGAIVVTFLFVLMLSHAGGGPSDENDRSREPLLGSLAGFAFVGLTLFALHRAAPPAQAGGRPAPLLPAPILAPEERAKLLAAADRLDASAADARQLDPKDAAAIDRWLEGVQATRVPVEEAALAAARRLKSLRHDEPAEVAALRAIELAKLARKTPRKVQDDADENRLTAASAEADAVRLRDGVRLMVGAGELPARNVANLGALLYSEHLLAVELAGTLLLVATVGAVAIAGRKGAPA